MPELTLYARIVTYRDETGSLHQVRIESTDPAEVDRIVRYYRRIEQHSFERWKAWQERITTFTDAGMDGDTLAKIRVLPGSEQGNPWDQDDIRFHFVYLLGDGRIWNGPGAHFELWQRDDHLSNAPPVLHTYGIETASSTTCPDCGGIKDLPPNTACLSCCRTGRDRVIPRPSTRDLERHAPEPSCKRPVLPPPLKDRMGRVLKGGWS